MQDFEQYIKSNYHVPNAAACNITYAFSNRAAKDRKTKVSVIIYTINMKLTWLDADGKLLQSEKLTFTNDELSKSSEKQLKTINPGDTTNKFRAAKQQIIHGLVQAKQAKIDALLEDRTLLLTYAGRTNDVISNEMKGTMHITHDEVDERCPLKTNFDM